MDPLVVLIILAVGIAFVVSRSRKRQVETQAQADAEALTSVKAVAEEDVTRLGEDVARLDVDTTGHDLDEAQRQDYRRALDAYDAAKSALGRVKKPDDIREVTGILEDGRYAIASLRARLAGEPLPARRPPCFFNPQHGPSTEDVDWAPPGGAPRSVPACAADAERVRAGAEPDIRQVMVGSQRVPYWQGGRAYQPYAAGYFGGFGPMNWMFMGMMFSGGFDGFGDGLGDGIGSLGDGIGDGIGSIGDGIGGMFDGFDF
jgi:type II secretory pathway pseudopilin PulG